MKIAVSASGNSWDAPVDPRFGRCAYLMIVDTDDMTLEQYPNENANLSGGAGIQSATFVISKGARAVLTGRCGPNAMEVFQAHGVEVFQGGSGTVQAAVEQFKSGALASSAQAMSQAKAGLSGQPVSSGVGRGMGGGGRRNS
jgi:predicted Fe-Mo cluster-binding NifX family protein